ncbi:tetratricopeptide repeat protein [Peptoniphilus sp.]|jgi:tetratricopeptide (TPR) repeat protein|uniref:tetratricopeptide repeat protein n=1 Tax=Peptoniphilus sp. TaxID=1971214 RepID=UPI003D8CA4C6
MNVKYKNYIVLSRKFIFQGDTLKAIKTLEKALDFAPNEDEKISILFEIADLEIENENFNNAKDIYKEILKTKEEPGAYYGLAMVGEFLKESDEYSIKNYKKAIDLDENYDRAHYYLALLYDKIGEKDLAINHFKTAISLNPYDYVSLNDLGSLYEGLNKDECAKKCIEKSLEINPDYGRALYNRGVLYKKEGKNDLALNVYYEAIDKFKDPFLFLNMSAIYIEEKRYKEALDILDTGLMRFPESVNLHYNKACVFSILGDKAKSKSEIKRAIEINKDAEVWASTDPDLMEIMGELRNDNN